MARAASWVFIIVLTVVGLILSGGGVVLLGEGGSLYYLLAGLATLASAAALFRRSGKAAAIYGLLLVGTLVWSLWEVGLDGWALAPRLLGPAVLGLLLLLAPVGKRRWIVLPALAMLATVGLAGVLATRGDFASAPVTAATKGRAATVEWRSWGQTIAGLRHVAADQINTGNIDHLKLAWRFDSGVTPQTYLSFEATPLAADGRLYVCIQPGIVAALDQDSGKQIWRYTMPGYAKIDFTKVFGGKCRGVSYYEAPTPTPDCPKRVLFTTPDGWFRAVDAATGQPCAGFGQGGAVDLHAGFGMPETSRQAVVAMPSSPPGIINGVAVIGQTVSDLESLDAPSGVIRGYDVMTGALKWAWDVERPDRPLLGPGETYSRATPNAWGNMGGDEALGLVFVPLGNSPPDYFGGMRKPASDRFTTAVAAIEVATGKLRWSFQTVHHDLWDYDLAAQPVSVDLPGKDGQSRPALIVPTKTGQIFVLDRRTGQPIDRVEERPVPQGGVAGERVARTQPFTTGFPSLAGPTLTERAMWGITPLDQMLCRIKFRRAHYQGMYTPVGTGRETIMYPGTAGGINWGSVTIDQVRGLLVVNTLRFANFGQLIPRAQVKGGKFGGAEGTAIFEQAGTPYVFAQSTFMSPLGVPCQQPPYGTIQAFDLKTRKPVWSKSLGTSAKSGPFGVPTLLPIRMGVPNMGGAISTAGGLVFIGAAQDRLLRALDIRTGRELWSAPLPAVAAATPMSYVSPKTGRQYVVIAAGGHYGLPGPGASALMAYALPGK